MIFTKFKVRQPIRGRGFTADTLRHAVILTFGPLTLNIRTVGLLAVS